MSRNRDEFIAELRAEVDEAPEEGGGAAAAFTRVVLDRLSDTGYLDNPIALWAQGSFGAARFRISEYALDEEQERLLLVTTIYTGERKSKPLSLEEIKTAVERAVRFFLECARGRSERIEPAGSEAVDLARLIGELHHRISFVRVLVISDGLMEKRRIEPAELEGTRISADLLGAERLQRILGEGVSRDDIVVDPVAITGAALPCLQVNTEESGYEAWLAAVPGEVLAKAYDEYGGRLLELNVRAFLGVRGRKSVNAGLQETLQKRPADFLAFNNGIVATADEVDVEETESGLKIRSLRGLQIVNGGQTTASLHRASRFLDMDLGPVRVPAKIIKVPSDALSQMVSDISRSANSQNTVQPADFSANDPFHVRLEELANNVWCPDGVSRWFYERARGSYGALEAKASRKAADRKSFSAETPKELRFSKTDVARYLNSWEGLPHDVSTGSQKNFQLFMQRLKEDPRRHTLDEAWYRRLIALAILYRSTQRIVREERYSAYQANIVAYTVAALSWRTGHRMDFELVWRNQAISDELANLLRGLSREVDRGLRVDAGARMVSEWAKKAEAWNQLRTNLPELVDPLPAELSASVRGEAGAGASGEVLEAGDLQLIDECRELSAEDLLEIVAWGHRNALPKWQIGLLNTVTAYAASGWQRSPSVKQARWVLAARNRYEESVAAELA